MGTSSILVTRGVPETEPRSDSIDTVTMNDIVHRMNEKGRVQKDIVTVQSGNTFFSYFLPNNVQPDDKIMGKHITYVGKKTSAHFEEDVVTCTTSTAMVGGEKHFYAHCNNSVFTVKVSSPNPMYLDEIAFAIFQGVKGEHSITLEDVTACFFTNLTFESILVSGTMLIADLGSLRYKQFTLGPLINFLYDNRSLYSVNNELLYYSAMFNYAIALTPGTWYFIFTSNNFDLDQSEQSSNMSVWMNFSGDVNDIEISTSEEGTIYALSYSEYNANIVYSKTWMYERIINGKTRFHITNTFVYQFMTWLKDVGYWNLHWNTPQGRMTYFEWRTENTTYFGKHNSEECLYGVGGSGEYMLRIGTFEDSTPDHGAMMPYFLGLDVKLD